MSDGAVRLLPCPFCGGEGWAATVRYGEQTVAEQRWESDTYHYVSCVQCSADNRGLRGFATPFLAAERWNTRVDLP